MRNYHSYHTSISEKSQRANTCSKSALDCSLSLSTPSIENAASGVTRTLSRNSSMAQDGDYYKNYEHDQVRVKDSNIKRQDKSLTDSVLDSLEKRIYLNVSQELQTDEGSLSSLDSNITFFKTTVEKIFENFYTCMKDFEHYKRRFNEILEKSKVGSVDEMEEFIKDMFDHIMSSENSISKIDRESTEKANLRICGGDSAAVDNELLEAFKNENYQTDSKETNNTAKRQREKDETFNINFLSNTPHDEINLIGRNILSEVNVKERRPKVETATSADNLPIVLAKKQNLVKLMNYDSDCEDTNEPDINIPVKTSFAKKDIRFNEDFSRNCDGNCSSRSFLSRLCSHLCRKFRKTTIV